MTPSLEATDRGASRPAAPIVRVALAAVLLVAAAAPAAAQQKSYSIPRYDVVLAVQPDGSYEVTEHITYDFRGGTFTHADREIPLRYIRSYAFGGLTADGARLTDVRPGTSGREARIEWHFAPVTGAATFTLGYHAGGALFESGGRDIVDWDAIGRAWPVTIANARVTVLLPASLGLDSADIQAQPVEGRVAAADGGWRVDYSYGPLPPRTAYRVVVSFPKRLAGRTDWPGLAAPAGVVERRPLPSSYVWLLPLAFLVGLFPGLWLLRSWAPPRREAFDSGAPPTSLPRAAAILPETAGVIQRVFSAVLFDLAARGHLRLERTAEGSGVFARKRVRIVYADAPPDETSDFERLLLAELHRYPSLDDFGRKASRFRRTMVAALRRQVLEEGLVETHGDRTVLVVVAGIACDLTGVAVLVLRGVSVLPLALLLFGAGLGLLLCALRYRVTTESGALLRAQVQAYLAARRRRVKELAAGSPVQAAEEYLRNLPWLTLDTRVTPAWLRRIVVGLKKSDEALVTPGWATDLADRATAGSEAYVAFMPYYHVTAATAAAASPGSGGAGAAGAGAGGGAGGGGGGAG